MFPVKNCLSQNGEAYYLPTFFTRSEADEFFRTLQQDVDWKADRVRLFGKLITTRRKTAWYGDPGMNYMYSGIARHPLPWERSILAIKHRIEEAFPLNFNSCLLNYYHDGNDGMGWHQDNEKELGDSPCIASISFGADRFFDFRHVNTQQKIRLLLESGSLLLMQGETQNFWKHALPKSKKILHPRINLTFRRIVTHSMQSVNP